MINRTEWQGIIQNSGQTIKLNYVIGINGSRIILFSMRINLGIFSK